MSTPQTPYGQPSPGEEFGQMAGEYRLGRKLGEGGFGAVFEAEHPLLKRRAAVKVLHRAAGVNSEAVLRFVSEAQAVNQIRSRHIVDIFSFGKLNDGRHFYVMDLLLGETLDRHRVRRGKLDPITTLQLLRPIAAALDAAHAAGIVHRDLKPQNVFLAWEQSGETVPKLLDFGMAKLLGDSVVDTVSGTPLGTPLYMSPEQARGEPVTRRADVYALGVVCHELLTGTPPIAGTSAVTVLMAQIVQAPPAVSSVCPELPSCLDAPILRMLAKKPEDRPESASAALDALAQALAEIGQVVPDGLPRLESPPPETQQDPAQQGPAQQDPAQNPASRSPAGQSPRGIGAVSLGEMTTEYHPMFGSQPAQRRGLPRWAPWAALSLVVASLFALTRLRSPETVGSAIPGAASNSSPDAMRTGQGASPEASSTNETANDGAGASKGAASEPRASESSQHASELSAASASSSAKASEPPMNPKRTPRAPTAKDPAPESPGSKAAVPRDPVPRDPVPRDPVPGDLESPF